MMQTLIETIPPVTARLRALVMIPLLLGLAACGGGEFDESATGTLEILQTGDSAEVFQGDELTRTSETARISVRHEDEGNRKFVTMLAGSAELLRGDFHESR